MNNIETLKKETKDLVGKYAVRSNWKALYQTLNTLIPYGLLFWLCMDSWQKQDYFVFSGSMFMLILFIVRVFMVMHDCGHKCMYHTQTLNKIFGFITGVIVGMPQYVWSKHHDYHHATNGNWRKYRGPLSTKSVDEYEQLSSGQQRMYRITRHILFAPIGAFMYFIFNPRFNWALGTIKFILHVVFGKLRHLNKPVKTIAAEFQPRYWNDAREYWHMTGNNIVLLSAWYFGSLYFGAGAFFATYLISLTLAGAIGIIVFTIQHNFEHSYASDDQGWDFYQAALYGTSFLTFPWFFHWFGLNIAYHHIHHLSSFIPNYNLPKCHKEYAELFTEVPRIKLRDVPKTMKYVLWDTKARRIISLKEYEEMKSATDGAAA